MESHVRSGRGNVEVVDLWSCQQRVQFCTAVLDHAQDVVVGGVRVGPLLHDFGDRVGVGPVGVELATHV